MHAHGITFTINKSFGTMQLVPEQSGLRILYTPIINGAEDPHALGYLNLLIPIEAIGGLWATTKAFLYGVESLDENVIMQGAGSDQESDILIKLYRDKPKGQQGKLSGEETCWLRLVTGRTEEERRRIKLGPRDLMCIELACQSVVTLSAMHGMVMVQRSAEPAQMPLRPVRMQTAV
jgi:hypothetical protein